MDECLSWDAVAAIASAVIALSALGLTVWQAVTARRHNRLSVTPHLTTWSHLDRGNNLYQIDLLNNGIGPALIKHFLIQVDGKSISGEASEPIEKALKILFPQYLYQSYQSYVTNGYMMSEKEARPLVRVQFCGERLPTSEEVDHAIKRVRLVIKYESIYGESDCLDTDTLRSTHSLN